MGLIDRYIFAVTQKLPEKQRDDIARELGGLIEDMLAERAESRGENAQPDDADIEAVLTELGNPSVLAAKYSGRPRYIVGPEHYDTYIFVLKIVLAASVFGSLVALAVHYAAAPPQYVGEVFGSVIGTVISSLFGAFGWITLIFALAEYFVKDTRADYLKGRKWRPSDLPDAPKKYEPIKKAGPVCGIVVITVLTIFLNFAAGRFVVSTSGVTVPVFSPVFGAYLPLIDVCLLLWITKAVLKLVFGCYNLRLIVSSAVISSAAFVLAVIAFSNTAVWNGDAVRLFEKANGIRASSGADILSWTVVGIIIFVYVIDMVTTAVRLWRNFSPDVLRHFGDGK